MDNWNGNIPGTTIPLPYGWEAATDREGKSYFIKLVKIINSFPALFPVRTSGNSDDFFLSHFDEFNRNERWKINFFQI